MSSPNNTSTSSRENGVAGADEKPRLTEEEKKQNHIASGMVPPFCLSPPLHVQHLHFHQYTQIEIALHATSAFIVVSSSDIFYSRANTAPLIEQKRRQAIREGFDRLTELVPGLEGQGRSEGLVLKRTVEYMRQQIQERRALVDRIEQSGGQVDEDLKK